LIEPISATEELTLDTAYRVQRFLTEARLARGELLVGWKLGYTSEAMRLQMGVAEPNFGPLTDAMLFPNDGTVDPMLVQPRVEPEIGIVLARPLEAGLTLDDVLGATAHAFACLEVVDSVYVDYRFRLEDNTADGSSAAQVVVGPTLPAHNLDLIEVAFFHNGTHLDTVKGSAACGHPANGVIWLADRLHQMGRRLEAGQIVITGSDPCSGACCWRRRLRTIRRHHHRRRPQGMTPPAGEPPPHWRTRSARPATPPASSARATCSTPLSLER
jgi:2-keto-4-pentenoate hydratase